MFLSVLIVAFGAAVSAASLVLLLDKNLKALLGDFPTWFNAFLVALLVARVVALYGIWRLKRLAVYLLLALELVETSTGLFVFTSVLPFPQRLGAVPVLLVLVLVWVLALRPRWSEFS